MSVGSEGLGKSGNSRFLDASTQMSSFPVLGPCCFSKSVLTFVKMTYLDWLKLPLIDLNFF